jgi:pantetheine-phosphate adenylyltransferase
MFRRAIFPGSFNPITIGHEDIILRALPLFDEIIIAVGFNSKKQYAISPEDRKAQIERIFKKQPKIKVEIYSGLTVEFCKSVHANYIIRGLRTSVDFDYERNIGLMNLELAPEIESVFLMSRPKYSAISSSVVRDIQKNGGDISDFIPKEL